MINNLNYNFDLVTKLHLGLDVPPDNEIKKIIYYVLRFLYKSNGLKDVPLIWFPAQNNQGILKNCLYYFS